MKIAFCGILLFAIVAFATVNCFDLEAILEKIPSEERMDFLKYHIGYGYKIVNANQTTSQKAKDYQNGLPKEFSAKLYAYALQHAKVTDEELLKKVYEWICFDDGTCIDLGDIGVYPV